MIFSILLLKYAYFAYKFNHHILHMIHFAQKSTKMSFSLNDTFISTNLNRCLTFLEVLVSSHFSFLSNFCFHLKNIRCFRIMFIRKSSNLVSKYLHQQCYISIFVWLIGSHNGWKLNPYHTYLDLFFMFT